MIIDGYQDFYNEIVKKWGGDDYKIGFLAWQEATARQQKKIDDLQLRFDMARDTLNCYKRVNNIDKEKVVNVMADKIDELLNTIAEQDKEIDMLHEKIDIIYKAIVIDDEEEEV